MHETPNASRTNTNMAVDTQDEKIRLTEPITTRGKATLQTARLSLSRPTQRLHRTVRIFWESQLSVVADSRHAATRFVVRVARPARREGE